MAMTWQDYLRKQAAYQRQQAITTGVPTGQAYSPELQAAYMEGQAAQERNARQLAIQEQSVEQQNEALKQQQQNLDMQSKAMGQQARMQKYQLGTQLGVVGGYGAYKMGWIGPGEAAAEEGAGLTATQAAITGGGVGAGAEAAIQAGAAEAGAEGGAAVMAGLTGGTESGAAGVLGPAAGAAALTYGAYEAGKAITGDNTAKKIAKAVISPFFDPVGTVKDVVDWATGGGK
jgi:hypothetical protein